MSMLKKSGEHSEFNLSHGNVYNLGVGWSFERVVLYLCLTSIALTWLLTR